MEIIQYGLAVVLVVAAVAWNQYLVPILVACVIAMPYAIWSRLQDIEQGSAPPRREQSAVSGKEALRRQHPSKRSATDTTAAKKREDGVHLNGVPSSAEQEWRETPKEPVVESRELEWSGGPFVFKKRKESIV
ncbi:MAG: hypothetical protein NNA30_10550 [Nitrospira sp.]|nr:hypothetical protein [Nitrospira sp.]